MNALRPLGLGALLCMGLALVGCATTNRQAIPDTGFWSGRIAIQIQSEPPQSMSAAFELQGGVEQGELILLSPIGSTLARLNWTAQSAQLSQAGRHWSANTLDELTTQITGTPLPITALFDWLVGRSSASADWQVDLSQLATGRITAQKSNPVPAVKMTILLER